MDPSVGSLCPNKILYWDNLFFEVVALILGETIYFDATYFGEAVYFDATYFGQTIYFDVTF